MYIIYILINKIKFYILEDSTLKNTLNTIFPNFIECLCIFMYHYVEGGKNV